MLRLVGVVITGLWLAGCDTGPPPPGSSAAGPAPAPAAAPAPAPAPAPAGAPVPLPAGFTEVTLDGGLSYGLPPGWVSQPPKNNMRKAQYQLPRADGDTTDAECVVFFFGVNAGGGVEDNLTRWIGQMNPAPGADPVRTQFEAQGCTVYTLDVEGDYDGGQSGSGGTAAARMLAAIVVTPGGKFFFKAIGPSKTIAAQADAFMKLCKTVRFEQR